MSEYLVFLHAVTGGVGTLLAVALAAVLLRSRDTGRPESVLAWTILTLFWITAFAGIWWYLTGYNEPKALIKAGPMPWAHNVVMEIKEHAFLVGLMVSSVLPTVVGEARRLGSPQARRMAALACVVVALIGLSMEALGAFVSLAIRLSMPEATV
ncbi:MAG: hypothetical protein KF858_03160 [Candidatus Sumerlaeia bacterium]|nr:hypothetical protein [Candidatus Sumerlaeia bacterium]